MFERTRDYPAVDAFVKAADERDALKADNAALCAVAEAAQHTVDEAYCEASEDDPTRIICPVDSLPELRAALAAREGKAGSVP